MENKYQWVLINENADFAPRDGAGLLSFKGKLWLLGGWNPKDKVNFPKICNNEVWVSDNGEKWDMVLKNAPWEGRHCAGYVVLDNKMWIVGGDANQGHYQPEVWNSEDGENWNLVNSNVPWGQRSLHHTLVYKDKIWIMGGQTNPQFVENITETIFYNDVWNSEDGKVWTRVIEKAPWEPRGMIGGNAVLDGKMWLIGGGTYDTPDFPPPRKYFNEVWNSSDGVNWEKVASTCPWQARSYHEVASFDGNLWVMEGSAGKGNLKDVWYSKDGISWNELKDTPWKPRHAASVVVHDGFLYMVTGNNLESDVWKLVAKK